MAIESRSRNLAPRRVLMVRIGAMGDVLHALPAVAALRRLHPECEIDWAIDPRWAALLPLGTVVDQVHRVPTREWKQRPFSWKTLHQIAGLRRAMRARSYDLCVDLQGTIRSSVVGRMAGAGRFIGLDAPRERMARMFYRGRMAVTAAHVIEQGCEMLGAAVGERISPAPVTLPVSTEAEAWCTATLARQGIAGEFVVMVPGAGWGAKRWPAERFGTVAFALAQHGLRTLVNAASWEGGDALAAQAVAASGGAAQVVGCSLPQLIALLRRASLVIAGDTGPLHLAAALGRPVVGLYGPTDPARNGPYGTAARVLRHPASQRDHHRRAQAEAGLLQISPAEVTAAALELLQAKGGAQ